MGRTTEHRVLTERRPETQVVRKKGDMRRRKASTNSVANRWRERVWLPKSNKGYFAARRRRQAIDSEWAIQKPESSGEGLPVFRCRASRRRRSRLRVAERADIQAVRILRFRALARRRADRLGPVAVRVSYWGCRRSFYGCLTIILVLVVWSQMIESRHSGRHSISPRTSAPGSGRTAILC